MEIDDQRQMIGADVGTGHTRYDIDLVAYDALIQGKTGKGHPHGPRTLGTEALAGVTRVEIAH